MKRFIDLGDQIYPYSEKPTFAFFCTVTNTFETFGGTQFWSSVDDFKEDYNGDDIERYTSLIPEQWNKYFPEISITILGKEIKAVKPMNYHEVIEVSNLEVDLMFALRAENFERAAELRDQINSLKNKDN